MRSNTAQEDTILNALVRFVLRRGNGWNGLPAHLFPAGRVVRG